MSLSGEIGTSENFSSIGIHTRASKPHSVMSAIYKKKKPRPREEQWSDRQYRQRILTNFHEIALNVATQRS
jgi:hypothetical protein